MKRNLFSHQINVISFAIVISSTPQCASIWTNEALEMIDILYLHFHRNVSSKLINFVSSICHDFPNALTKFVIFYQQNRLNGKQICEVVLMLIYWLKHSSFVLDSICYASLFSKLSSNKLDFFFVMSCASFVIDWGVSNIITAWIWIWTISTPSSVHSKYVLSHITIKYGKNKESITPNIRFIYGILITLTIQQSIKQIGFFSYDIAKNSNIILMRSFEFLRIIHLK